MTERQTLGEFLVMMQSVPGGDRIFDRINADTFEKFISLLQDDIDDIVREMEQNPDHHYDLSEDRLTYFVEALLRQRQYRASKGTHNGGNIDLTVTGRRDGFSWIAEAKIYGSLTDLREGFLQMHTRYRSEDIANAKVGMLIYIKREHPRKLMSDWQEELGRMGLIDLSFRACPSRPLTAFLTVHSPVHSDIATETRHISVSLFHKPIDKSGRVAEKYKHR